MPVSNLIRYFIRIIVVGCVLSCSQKEAYYKFKPISNHQWSKGEEVVFIIDSLNGDTSGIFSLSVEVVHNITYPYKNLSLSIEHVANDILLLNDTIKYVLIDNNRRWIGSGNGAMRQITLPYMKPIQIDPALRNKIILRHAMQDLYLIGIEKVGLRVD